jgi:hypothetical protein
MKRHLARASFEGIDKKGGGPRIHIPYAQPERFSKANASTVEDQNQLLTRCGAVPSAADRWPSSNDLQPQNSNSVLHRSWPRLHEITRPHAALSTRFRASRRSVSPLPPDNFFPSPPRLTSAINSSLHRSAGSSSGGHDNSRELLHPSLAPFNLDRSRVRRASGFLLTAFSNTTPHTSCSLEHSSGVASEKALA